MTTSSRSASAGTTEVSAIDTSWIELVGKWNMEVASFYGRRMQEWASLPARMMQCHSTDDLAEAQEQFSKKLIADYREAAGKLMASTGLATASSSDAGEAYAAVLLKAQQDAGKIIEQAKAQAKRIIGEQTGDGEAEHARHGKSRVA